MKKAVLVPDSFKGTMSSIEICEIMSEKISQFYPDCTLRSVPVADGGEGSVDCFLTALGGEKIYCEVNGPYFEKMRAFYGILPDNTAVIEMAACAGLPLVDGRLNPEKTSTYGVGELILDAAKRGCKKIILGLGGSCTNDAGCGAAAAVGIKYFDKNNNSFIPTGGTLCDVASVSLAEKSPLLSDVEIITMCDIDNPLFGKKGAAYVFAPQKGADPSTVEMLDAGLMHISEVIRRDLGCDVSTLPGGGAAGGFGAGMSAFLSSKLQMGIETVLDAVDFDTLIADADVVFTGEGRLDSQSLRGKVVIGVAKRCALRHVPVVAVVGDAESDIAPVYDAGVTAVFSTNRKAEDFKVMKPKTKEYFTLTFENIMRFYRMGR